MIDNTLVLEKKDYHNNTNTNNNNRRVCLVNADADNKNTSFIMPEATLILFPPFTSYSSPQHQSITTTDKKDGLRSSLRNDKTVTTTTTKGKKSTKTVHFNVPLTEVLYFNYQEDMMEDEESVLEDAFLDFYTKSFNFDLLDINQLQYEMLIEDDALNNMSLKNKNFVYLEQLYWENSGDIMWGSIVVHNLAFEKHVIARLTFDDWKSYINIDAGYKESVDPSCDRFLFEVNPFEHMTAANNDLPSLTCRLAIQYIVNGYCYWDNNYAKDYTVRWLIQPVSNTGFCSFSS